MSQTFTFLIYSFSFVLHPDFFGTDVCAFWFLNSNLTLSPEPLKT